MKFKELSTGDIVNLGELTFVSQVKHTLHGEWKVELHFKTRDSITLFLGSDMISAQKIHKEIISGLREIGDLC